MTDNRNKGNSISNIYLLTALLFTLILSINYLKKCIHCAAIFTGIAFIVNTLTHFQGYKKTMISLSVCIVIGLIITSISCHTPYYIEGKVIPWLRVSSLLSILLSSFFGARFFSQWITFDSFATANLLSLWIYDFIDSIVITIFLILLDVLATPPLITIFLKEIYSKIAAALIVYGILRTVKGISSTNRRCSTGHLPSKHDSEYKNFHRGQ